MNDPLEPSTLEELAPRFFAALGARDAGDLEAAEEQLLGILRIEPRLAEPRMELARILLDTDRLAEAEEHAREALGVLEKGGQWTADLAENVVQSICHALLAEILRRRADEDDVIFGDPATWRALVDDSKEHFAKAAELDPSDDTSSYYAFFMGIDGVEPTT